MKFDTKISSPKPIKLTCYGVTFLEKKGIGCDSNAWSGALNFKETVMQII